MDVRGDKQDLSGGDEQRGLTRWQKQLLLLAGAGALAAVVVSRWMGGEEDRTLSASQELTIAETDPFVPLQFVPLQVALGATSAVLASIMEKYLLEQEMTYNTEEAARARAADAAQYVYEAMKQAIDKHTTETYVDGIDAALLELQETYNTEEEARARAAEAARFVDEATARARDEHTTETYVDGTDAALSTAGEAARTEIDAGQARISDYEEVQAKSDDWTAYVEARAGQATVRAI